MQTHFLILAFLALLLPFPASPLYTISITNSTNVTDVTDSQGAIKSGFLYQKASKLTCSMSELFIYADTTHDPYFITTLGIGIRNITGTLIPITVSTLCEEFPPEGCTATLTNGCRGTGRNQLNTIVVELTDGTYFEYMVSCSIDNQPYKPFEWGMVILICSCTILITVSSFYSRAWAYKGYGLNLKKRVIMAFTLLMGVQGVLAYYIPHIIKIQLKIIGSTVGMLGVTVCTAEALWLFQSPKLTKKLIWHIRVMDLISVLIGAAITLLYWLTGIWIINNILATCAIIACLKFLKLRSLSTGILMLYSFLLFQILASLVVHLILKTNYNNLVIRLFEDPLILLFPTITPEVQRRCAWIPISNVLFPGLFISYLRRFDKSRGTFMYLFIGWLSYCIGSILWMLLDMNTSYQFPMGIISVPVTTIIVLPFAYRRNQFQTIWTGFFYDTELPDLKENILPHTTTGEYIAFQDFTNDLRTSRTSKVSNLISVDGEI